MRFAIVLAPKARKTFRGLPARLRAHLRDALETHLRHAPTKLSKSRIKRLRGMRQPQYRLRVGDLRVLYDVWNETVEVLAIVTKAQAQAWLDEEGAPDANSGAGEGEG
jgi:mRNA-degrading endonuclease RelE of RelBE toxin-antitoxin system